MDLVSCKLQLRRWTTRLQRHLSWPLYWKPLRLRPVSDVYLEHTCRTDWYCIEPWNIDLNINFNSSFKLSLWCLLLYRGMMWGSFNFGESFYFETEWPGVGIFRNTGSVEQSAINTARQYRNTTHIQAATENALICSMINTVRRCCESGAVI